MAETDAPLLIEVQFDTTQPEQALDRLEERARRGINVSGEGTTRRGGTVSPGGPASADVQSRLNAAAARGDYATVRQLSEQAQGGGDRGARSRAERVDRSWDQASFAQFKEQERAEQRLSRARDRQAMAAERLAERDERRSQVRATRIAESEDDADLSAMGPNAQQSRLREMAGRTNDPLRRARLERRANALRGKTGMNTEIMSTGMLMSLMFSGWEAMGGLNAMSEADRFATMNPSDLLGQLNAQNTAITRMTSGPLGSWLGMMTSGSRQRTAEIQGGAGIIDARTKAMAEFGLTSESRRQNAYIASGADEFEKKRREIEIEKIEATKEVNAKLNGLTILSKDQQRTGLARIDEEYGRRIRAATTVDASGGSFTNVPEIHAAEAYRAAQIESVNAQDKGNVDKRRKKLEDEIATLNIPFDQKKKLVDDAERGFRNAPRLAGQAGVLAAQGLDIDAAVLAIAADLQGGAISGNDALDRVAAVRVAADRESARHGFSSSEGYRQAERARERRINLVDASSQALILQAQRKPLEAQLAMIEAERVAGLPDVGTTPSRAQLREIDAHNRAAAVRAIEAVQSRADLIQDVNLNQDSRFQQLAALKARDPIGAQAVSMNEQARAEEIRLRRAGLNEQADNALDIGQRGLDLLKRDYMDAFQGVPVSKDMAQALAFGLIKNAGENPVDILKSIRGERDDLDKKTDPNAQVPPLLQQLIDKVGGLAAFLTN